MKPIRVNLRITTSATGEDRERFKRIRRRLLDMTDAEIAAMIMSAVEARDKRPIGFARMEE